MPWLCQIISSTIATLFQSLLPDEQNSDRGTGLLRRVLDAMVASRLQQIEQPNRTLS